MVVYNTTFQVTAAHASICTIVQLNNCSYSTFKIRAVIESWLGDGYIEIYDDNNSATNAIMQDVHVSLINLRSTNIDTYTTFTDGTVIPTGYNIRASLTTVLGNTLVGNLKGDAETVNSYTAINTPATNEKKDLIGMINETFQYANSGKNNIASAIGSPSTNSETFTQLASDITTNKNNIYNAITAKGTTPASKNFSDLIGAIGNISTGKRYMSGGVMQANNMLTVNNLGFTPRLVLVIVDQCFIIASTILSSTYAYYYGMYGSYGSILTYSFNSSGFIINTGSTFSSSTSLPYYAYE